ncbi:MAG: enoyl-CoA hydratase/isomerase family protein [Betaproteobacteria bacterium]
MSIHVAESPGRLRLTLDAPNGNAITDAMVGAMRAAVDSLDGRTPPVKLVTVEGAGADFSFGSSLPEHVPARMPDVLPRFHALVRALIGAPAVTAALVQGRCLGGGFELALACDFVFAADDAVMGLPEIAVGAFPPVGSVLLPLKIGAARAASAILSGGPRPVGDWQQAGLIEQVVPRAELSGAVDRWYAWTLEKQSAAALRHAAQASRLTVSSALDSLLPHAERRYLNELLATADAAEGVTAFLEKRAPRWKDA